MCFCNLVVSQISSAEEQYCFYLLISYYFFLHFCEIFRKINVWITWTVPTYCVCTHPLGCAAVSMTDTPLKKKLLELLERHSCLIYYKEQGVVMLSMWKLVSPSLDDFSVKKQNKTKKKLLVFYVVEGLSINHWCLPEWLQPLPLSEMKQDLDELLLSINGKTYLGTLKIDPKSFLTFRCFYHWALNWEAAI